jgi:hypothetical protein
MTGIPNKSLRGESLENIPGIVPAFANYFESTLIQSQMILKGSFKLIEWQHR